MMINGYINALFFHPAAFGVYLESAPPLETKGRDVLLGTLDAFTELLGDRGVDVSHINKTRSTITSMAGADCFRSDLMAIARVLRQVPNGIYFEVATLMMETGEMVFGLHQREDIAGMHRVMERPSWIMSIRRFCQGLATTSTEDAQIWGDMGDRFTLAGLDARAAGHYIRAGLKYKMGACILFAKGQEAAKEKHYDYAKRVMKGALALLNQASVVFERGGRPEQREKITALETKIRRRLDWLDLSHRQGNPGEPRWSTEAMISIAKAAHEEM